MSKATKIVEQCQDYLEISKEAYAESREEALKVFNYFHNRQYTKEQIRKIKANKQPVETFNVIKTFGRMLLGYYSTLINTNKVYPVKIDESYNASLLNDSISYVYRKNNFISEGDKLKLDAILAGMMVSHIDVINTGKKDEFNRPKYDIKLEPVSALECLPDPMSKKDDDSDSRFFHIFKWVSEEDIIKNYGKAKLAELDEYDNHIQVQGAEYTDMFNSEAVGKYKKYGNYLVIHTIINYENKVYSVHWSGNTELFKKEITFRNVKPYRVQKIQDTNLAEFYGIFREIMGTQDAINQALIKIQQLVNTQKVMVTEGAVTDIEEFTNAFYRVNAVIKVKNLKGIEVVNNNADIQNQYIIIDKGLNRIQRILSINDSFLGMAYASDSGAKVKLQQNASMVALRYLTAKIEKYYRLLGWDILNLIQQYWTYHDMIRMSDNLEGDRWIEINKPMEVPVTDNYGNVAVREDGSPITRYIFEEMIDPDNGEVMLDEEGKILMTPIPTKESEIQFTEAEIEVTSVAYDDEDEKNQALLDNFINSPLGQSLQTIDPVGYFKAGSLAIKNTKTKYSLEISNILDKASDKLQQNMQMQQQAQIDAQANQPSNKQLMNRQQGY